MLNNINLDDHKTISGAIDIQKEIVKILEEPAISNRFNTWTIIYFIIFSVVGYFI